MFRIDSWKNSTNIVNLVRFLFQLRVEFHLYESKVCSFILNACIHFSFPPSVFSLFEKTWRVGQRGLELRKRMEMYIFPGLGRVFYTRCKLNLGLDHRYKLPEEKRRMPGIDRSFVITFVSTPRFKWDDNLAQQAAVYISFTIDGIYGISLIRTPRLCRYNFM